MPDFKPTSEGSDDAGSSAQRKATSPLFNTLPCWQTFSVCWLYSIFTYAYLYKCIYINTRLSNKSENYIFSYIPLVIYIYIPVQYVCYVIYIVPIISSSNQPAAQYFSEFETEIARCPPNCPSERPGRMRALRSCSSGVFCVQRNWEWFWWILGCNHNWFSTDHWNTKHISHGQSIIQWSTILYPLN